MRAQLAREEAEGAEALVRAGVGAATSCLPPPAAVLRLKSSCSVSLERSAGRGGATFSRGNKPGWVPRECLQRAPPRASPLPLWFPARMSQRTRRFSWLCEFCCFCRLSCRPSGRRRHARVDPCAVVHALRPVRRTARVARAVGVSLASNLRLWRRRKRSIPFVAVSLSSTCTHAHTRLRASAAGCNRTRHGTRRRDFEGTPATSASDERRSGPRAAAGCRDGRLQRGHAHACDADGFWLALSRRREEATTAAMSLVEGVTAGLPLSCCSDHWRWDDATDPETVVRKSGAME